MERKTPDTAPPGQAVRTAAYRVVTHMLLTLRNGDCLVDGQLARETCL